MGFSNVYILHFATPFALVVAQFFLPDSDGKQMRMVILMVSIHIHIASRCTLLYSCHGAIKLHATSSCSSQRVPCAQITLVGTALVSFDNHK